MHLVKENDVYKREREAQFSTKERITFKHPEEKIYEKPDYDWYMTVTLEKSDLVNEDRHLLTAELLQGYRWAIREGYNHNLDKTLTQPYSVPRNKNTVKGIQSYIERIKRLSDEEMKNLDNQ